MPYGTLVQNVHTFFILRAWGARIWSISSVWSVWSVWLISLIWSVWSVEIEGSAGDTQSSASFSTPGYNFPEMLPHPNSDLAPCIHNAGDLKNTSLLDYVNTRFAMTAAYQDNLFFCCTKIELFPWDFSFQLPAFPKNLLLH